MGLINHHLWSSGSFFMPQNRGAGSEEPAIRGKNIIKTDLGEAYQLVLPLVPNDDSVQLLSHELEELHYSLLYQAYSVKGRNPAVVPKTMSKILTCAYSQNMKPPADGTLTLCGGSPDKKRPITARLGQSWKPSGSSKDMPLSETVSKEQHMRATPPSLNKITGFLSELRR